MTTTTAATAATASNNTFETVEYNDVYQFNHDTRDFLTRDESKNNLVLGIIQILCDPAQEYFTSYYMLSVVHATSRELCLVAVWTPIYNLVLSVVRLPKGASMTTLRSAARCLIRSGTDDESIIFSSSDDDIDDDNDERTSSSSSSSDEYDDHRAYDSESSSSLKTQLFQCLHRSMLQKMRIVSGLFAQKDDAILFAALWREQYLRHMTQPMYITTKMSERLYELKPIDLKVDCPYTQYEMKQQQQQQQQQQQVSSWSSSTDITPGSGNNNNNNNHNSNQHLRIEQMSMEDYETCLDWMVHFQQESGFYSSVPPDLIRKLNKSRLDLLVKTLCIYTLRNMNTNRIVSMSAVNAETPNGGRVGWVYTPIEERGKGYSQICVSRMCDRVFKEKRKQKMFLFADKANSAANHLYRKIGFKEVCDVENLSFMYSEWKSNL